MHGSDGRLTANHIRRRIDSALPKTRSAESNGEVIVAASPFAAPVQPGLGLRLKTQVVERYLPRVNLTSYQSLLRALSKWERTSLERDRLAADAAMLAGQRDHLRRELEEASAERDSVRALLETATREIDTRAQDAAVAASELASLAASRDQLLEDLAAATAARERLEVELRELRSQHDAIAGLGPFLTPIHSSLELIELALHRLVGQSSDWPKSSEDALKKFDEVRRLLVSRRILPLVRNLLLTHYSDEDDPNLARLLAIYDQAEAQFVPYWDVRAAVRALSQCLAPRTYLEVGTRRGWSLAQVFAEAPTAHAFVFELWEPNYGSAEQGFPDFIRAKMQSIVGERGAPQIEFIEGNSHDTLPGFFEEPGGRGRSLEFDLITVDGDHSRLGAWWDLYDLLPRVALGGALVFDDLEYAGDPESVSSTSSRFARPPLPVGTTSLMDVWSHMQLLHPNFKFLSCASLPYRAGIAMRVA